MHLTHYYVGEDQDEAERVIRASIAQADETHVSKVRAEVDEWSGYGGDTLIADPAGPLWNVVGWTRS